jgi:presenilin-like A22 family membrane protease
MIKMITKRRIRLSPVYWSILIFIVAQMLTFLVIPRENEFLQANLIYVPPVSPGAVSIWPQPAPPAPPGETPAPAVGSLGPILIYFAAVLVALGIVLFFIPASALRWVLRILFAFLFSWGIFIMLVFWLPTTAAIIISAAVGASWIVVPRVWLHNSVMVLTLVSLGAVFGRLISPWTSMILIIALAVYDFLAVRFGYMLWMTKKLSESRALPAFVIPRYAPGWSSSLKQSGFISLVEEKPLERQYSILGGGDIGFPLLLVSSVYFGYGLTGAILVAGFSFAGLICAYWIQSAFLKGRPMPALPPIAVLSLIALVIIRFSGNAL